MLETEIQRLNDTWGLEIDLSATEEIYGADMLESMDAMAQEVVSNIEYLLELGFDEGVSDICNRYGPILMEDCHIFRDNVDRLISSLGHDAIDQLAEDMSLWEELM